jgi:WS/DGAT/MGAT family acyltransferase
MPFAAPLTVLNGAIGPHRRVAFAELALGALKEVKEALGGTVNDVVLATVAGALRRFLLGRGASVNQALVAMVPVSVRVPDEHGLPGNRVSVMLVELPVNHADPLRRLERVKAATRRAKEQHGALGAHTIQALAEVTPGALAALAARLYTRTRAADRHRPIWNLVVSNVPGPRIPLYCAGARMEAFYPLGPIHEMSGLNVTLLSYLDTIFVGLNADRDLVGDVDRIAAALGEAVQELVKAAGEQRG